MEDKKVKKLVRLYPWYAGLSGDLLFWIAIDTLFLTIVKGFSEVQIESLTTISLITCIVLQFPILKLIKVIGNTYSIRISSAMMLVSSILLTIGNNYVTIVIGKIFYEVSFIFHNMVSVALKNNLEVINKSEDFVKLKSKQNTIYSVITMIISFVASLLFNAYNYLPMILCISFCVLTFIMSFNIIDFSDNNKPVLEKSENFSRFKISITIFLILLSYGLFFSIVSASQSDGKLFIQQELLVFFDVEKTALIIGLILAVSRIMRVVSNLIFNKIYKNLKDKIGIALPVLLLGGIGLILIGYFINIFIYLKFSLMAIGYLLFLFIRDPYNIYIQNVLLNHSNKEDRQIIITLLSLSNTILRAILSLCFTLILIKNPMIFIVIILVLLAVVEVVISIVLFYRIISSTKSNKDTTVKC